MKKLLVIIPYYNVGEYLEEAIEGIIQQSYQNWHLVLIDDASTDNSKQIAKRYKDNDKVSLLYNNENKGCYYSVNKALSAFSDQKWDYWHYHGGDDVSDLTRFDQIMAYLTQNPKMLGCKSTFARMIYDTREVTNSGTSEGIAFYSRKAFDNLGYYHDTRFGGDTDYFWRLGAWIKTNNLDYELGEHKPILYIAYRHDNNLTIKYNWTHDRPQYWAKIQKEINEVMIPNNNFHREIF